MLGEGSRPDDREEGAEVLGAEVAVRDGSCRLGVDLQPLRGCPRLHQRWAATARIAAGAPLLGCSVWNWEKNANTRTASLPSLQGAR